MKPQAHSEPPTQEGGSTAPIPSRPSLSVCSPHTEEFHLSPGAHVGGEARHRYVGATGETQAWPSYGLSFVLSLKRYVRVRSPSTSE